MTASESNEFANVYVALLWIGFWSLLFYKFRKQIGPLLAAFTDRIQNGSAVSAFGISLGQPPQQLRNSTPGSAAVFDNGAASVVPDTEKDLTAKYAELQKEDYFLLHAAEVLQPRTAPKSGRYRVRIWVESYFDNPLEIERVTYRLWDDFSPPVIETASKETNFDVWLTVYGEFPVLAKIDRKDNTPVYVTRYVDLPGRPSD